MSTFDTTSGSYSLLPPPQAVKANPSGEIVTNFDFLFSLKNGLCMIIPDVLSFRKQTKLFKLVKLSSVMYQHV